MSTERPLLEAKELSVTFGGLMAVSDVSLRVESGQLVGLIGPNGAGKTTFLDAIMGFVKSTGKVVLGGKDLSGWPPNRRARAGLLRTWQSLELFEDLTVLENLEVVSDAIVGGGTLSSLWHSRKGRQSSAAPDALERLGLTYLSEREPGVLSQGEQKLVSVARALVGRPQVLCMDEPAAGLNSSESIMLGEHLRGLVEDGLSMLLVDHDMGLMLSVCDVIYVLEFGAVIACGTPDVIRADERVISAYLGGSQEPRVTNGSATAGGQGSAPPT
ncbi:MAG TPA: ABC transporter ATP-binding protein [Acidimicrobiales bacterium]